VFFGSLIFYLSHVGLEAMGVLPFDANDKCLFIDLIVVIFTAGFLYKLVDSYVRRNQQVENDLRRAKENLEAYINELEQAKLNQKELTNKLTLITEGIPCLIAHMDSDQRYLYVNKNYADWLGVTAAELVGKTVKETLGEEIYSSVAGAIEKVIHGEACNLERVTEVKGERRTQHVQFVPECYSGEGTRAYFALINDITETKQLEAELRTMASRLQLAISSGKLGIWDWDIQNDVTTWDDRMFELYGIDRDIFLGSLETWHGSIHPDDRLRALLAIEATIYEDKGYDIEFRVVHPDGTIKHVKANGMTLRDSDGRAMRMVGLNLDVTERKQMESALEQRLFALTRPLGSTEGLRFEDLFNLGDIQRLQDSFAAAMGVAASITDFEGKPITEPSNITRIISKTGKTHRESGHSDSYGGGSEHADPRIQGCLSGGMLESGTRICIEEHLIANWQIGHVFDDSFDTEALVAYAVRIGANEEEFRCALADVPRMSREQFDRVTRALALFSEQLSHMALQNFQQARLIAERKWAEQILLESEERYRKLFNEANEGMVLADIETGLILEANRAFLRLAGYEGVEIVGQPQTVLHPPEDGAPAFSKSFAEHRATNDGTVIESELMTKSGMCMQVEIKTTKVELEGRTCLLGFFQERQRRLEHEIKDS